MVDMKKWQVRCEDGVTREMFLPECLEAVDQSEIVCRNAEIQRSGSVVFVTTGCTNAPTTPSAVKASGLHFLRML